MIEMMVMMINRMLQIPFRIAASDVALEDVVIVRNILSATIASCRLYSLM